MEAISAMIRVILSLIIIQHTVIDAEWSYTGQTGPSYWGTFYPACTETRQSPINILHDVAETDSSLTPFRFFGYNDTHTLDNLTVWNDGYTVTVRVHGELKVDGGGLTGKYSLKHFHFHWASTNNQGSEHWLDGQAYPLEMHLVHQKSQHRDISQALTDPSGLAVLGIFAKIGKYHEKFQAIIDNLRLLDIGDWATIRPFPLGELLPEDTETYYRYQGSLTTPPCSESVVWTVFRSPIEISQKQMDSVRMLSAESNVTSNFRPLQQLNGRKLFVRKKYTQVPSLQIVDEGQNFTADWNNDENSAATNSKSFALNLVVVLSLFNIVWHH